VRPPASDTQGPVIRWTAPKHKEKLTLAVLEVGQDSKGKLYYPAIQAGFSEAVDPRTVNSQTVLVTNQAGKAIQADVRYDAAVDQLQLLMREEPKQGQSFAVTVTPGVKDLRGNPLAKNYSWSFTILGVRQPAEAPNLYLPTVSK
jgi:hypothetical protein